MVDHNRIDEIERLIFGFQIPEAMQEFAALTEELVLVSGSLPQAKLETLLLIITAVNSALTNKDYLLFNDLLEYELKPFMQPLSSNFKM